MVINCRLFSLPSITFIIVAAVPTFWHKLGAYFTQIFENSSFTSIHFILEPIGSVAPRVNIESELNIARANFGESFSLKCPAQSYPIPAYR